MPMSINDGFKFGIGFVICLILGELIFVAIALMLFGYWIRSMLPPWG
jgi:hypothetical protein